MYSGYNGDPDVNFLPNNPFLVDLEASTTAQQQTGKERTIKLPEFWPHAPQIWFARAELQFEVNNIIDERQRFAYVANALPCQNKKNLPR